MDDSIRKQIIGIRSKYCEPILEILAKEGELYHGDLAEKLNMSPSGLNGIIKKMLECNPPIIEVMEIGKYKIYTLPPSVKEYIENKFDKDANNLRKDNAGTANVFDETESIMLTLQHFSEKAGRQWRDKLNLLLQGKDDDIDAETAEQYRRLMKKIVYASKYNEDEFQQLKNFLHNEVLEYLVQSYLDELKECEELLTEISYRENGKNLLRHIELH